MPRRKTYRRKKKRTYRRRKKKLAPFQGVPSGFPLQRVQKLRYVDKDTFTCTSGILVSDHWGANCAFDPYLGAGGHQPMLFDTWSAMYNHYVVLGARCQVQFSSVQGEDFVAGVFLNNDIVMPYTSYPGYIEARRGGVKYLTNQTNTKTAYCNFSAKKYFNVKDVKDNIGRLGSTIAGNPSEVAVFSVWGQPLDQATTQTLTMVVIIDYIVLWSEPRDIVQS